MVRVIKAISEQNIRENYEQNDNECSHVREYDNERKRVSERGDANLKAEEGQERLRGEVEGEAAENDSEPLLAQRTRSDVLECVSEREGREEKGRRKREKKGFVCDWF